MQLWMKQMRKNYYYYYYYYYIVVVAAVVEAAAAASADTIFLHKHLRTFKCCRHTPRGPRLSFTQS
jgi:hypothetical protein